MLAAETLRASAGGEAVLASGAQRQFDWGLSPNGSIAPVYFRQSARMHYKKSFITMT
jgi:hypothetical protein